MKNLNYIDWREETLDELSLLFSELSLDIDFLHSEQCECWIEEIHKTGIGYKGAVKKVLQWYKAYLMLEVLLKSKNQSVAKRAQYILSDNINPGKALEMLHAGSFFTKVLKGEFKEAMTVADNDNLNCLKTLLGKI